MADPSIVGFDASRSAQFGTTQTFPLPAGTAAGDLLLVPLFLHAAPTTITPPDGWTSLGFIRANSTTWIEVFTGTAVAGQTSVTFTLGSSYLVGGATIAIASGVVGASATRNGGLRTTTPAPAVTLGAGAMTVAFFISSETAGTLTSTPALGLLNNPNQSNAKTGAATWAPNEVGGTGTAVLFEHAEFHTAALTVAIEPAAVGNSLAAAAGSVAASGQAASFRRALRLSTEAGGATLAGQPATLEKVTTRTLKAERGALAATGQPASAAALRRLAAETGTLPLAGPAPTLGTDRALGASAGAMPATGQLAALRRSLRLSAEAGSTTVAEQPAAIGVARRLSAAVDALSAAGQPVAFLLAPRLLAAGGALALTGQGPTATFGLSRRLATVGGSLAARGQSAALARTEAASAMVCMPGVWRNPTAAGVWGEHELRGKWRRA